MSARIAKAKWNTQFTRYAVVLLFGAPLLFSPGARSADGPASDSSTKTVVANSQRANSGSAPSETEFQELKKLLQVQSAELDQLSRALKEQQAKTQALEQEFNAKRTSETSASIAPAEAIDNVPNAFPRSAPDSDAPPNAQTISQSRQRVNISAAEHPLSIKIGAADFTPGGFLDLTAISRSVDVGSGLGTNFTALPYNNSLPLGQLSEFRFTGQGSRLSLKVDAPAGKSMALTGYFESDFNGFEPANSNISSKSDSFRLRLAFVRLRHGKWEIVTGQTWSLLTATRRGAAFQGSR